MVLVLDFESRRGEILNTIARMKKDQLLRASSVGRHIAMRLKEGRKS